MSGSGVWVVETGCKYDNCGDVERYAVYDNEAAADKHGEIIDELLDPNTNLEVRVYEVVIPSAQFSEVPPLDPYGRVIE